jgi:hypothetical protein
MYFRYSTHLYFGIRLYISYANNPPNIWTTQYGKTSSIGNLPETAMVTEIIGLIYPPERFFKINIINENVNPIIKGLFVESTTKIKRIDPINSYK